MFPKLADQDPAAIGPLVHFGLTTQNLQSAVREFMFRDIDDGIAKGRVKLRPDQDLTAKAMMSGTVLASVMLIADGPETPLRAGENLAEMILRAFRVDPDEAAELARVPLTQIACRAGADQGPAGRADH